MRVWKSKNLLFSYFGSFETSFGGQAKRGKARRGEARRREARQGEARRGEARPGEAGPGGPGISGDLEGFAPQVRGSLPRGLGLGRRSHARKSHSLSGALWVAFVGF